MKFERKAKKYIKGKGIKPPTNLPDFLLQLKGANDGTRPTSHLKQMDVPNRPSPASTSYITRLIRSTEALINKEIVIAEEILYPVRKEAATIITSIDVLKESLQDIPTLEDEPSALAARTNKKITSAKNSLISAIRSNYSTLSEINEFIITISTVLEQRIDKTKTLCKKKISAYEVGLRSKCTSDDFEINVDFNDTSLKNYLTKHKILDDKIKEIVNMSEEASK